MHKDPQQLLRLIRQLDDGSSCFFIHIDRNVKLDEIKKTIGENIHVTIVPSIKTEWGSFGLVQATINAMKVIKRSPLTFDRITTLSGQDYPIKSNAYIDQFYQEAKQSIFIDYHSIPNYKKWSVDGGLYRVNKYFLGFSSFSKNAARIANFLADFFKIFKRQLKYKLKPYHGSQWWTIDTYALDYILDFVRENPGYMAFHKHTFAPDELFFQTILLNAHDARITRSIANDNKVFIKWENSSSAHPEILTIADFDDIKNSSALFARKFDAVIDNNIQNLIDHQLLRREANG